MKSTNHSLLLEAAADSRDLQYYLTLAQNLLSDYQICAQLNAASYEYNVVHVYDCTTKINKFFH